MLHKKKIAVFFTLSVFVLFGVAAVKPSRLKNSSSGQVQKDRNLKVLPKDISDVKLDSIMQTYNISLGVKCNFCHVPMKNIADSLDYVSDAEPMKEEARKMMRMTIHINKTNFYFDRNIQPEYLNTVHCNTCHRGEPFPEY